MKRRLVPLVLLLFLLFLMTAPGAMAATFKRGGTITIPEGQVINDDLYVAGGTVTIEGDVNGDLIVSGGTVIVNGNVKQDLLAAGGTVILNGTVGDDIRAAGGTVTINKTVQDDVVVAGGTIDIQKGSTIRGDLIAAAGDIGLRGRVTGQARISGGSLAISGTVGGNLRFEGDRLRLSDGARIGGNLTYRAPARATISDGARVDGKTAYTRTPRARERREAATAGQIIGAFVFALFWFFVFLIGRLIVGVLFVLMSPNASLTITKMISDKPWPVLGIGLAVLFVTPFVSLILMFTLVGIPLALIILGLYALAIYLSMIVTGLWLGRLILGSFARNTEPRTIWAMTLGVVILAIVTAIPFLGWLISLVSVVFGLGALAVGTNKIFKAERAQGLM